MDQAREGKEALKAGDYSKAIDLYSLAIHSNPTAVDYYIQRSIAYTRLQPSNYLLALKDAETAALLAYKREKKELIIESQLRRAIVLANLDRLGDADFLLKLARSLQGQRNYRNPGADNATLDMWETRVETKMRKLNADDEKLKVTVKEKPEVQEESTAATDAIDKEQQEAADKAKAKEEKKKAGMTQAAKDIRYDYYQAGDVVTLTIYAKNVSKEAVTHELKEDSVSPHSLQIYFTY
jgi:suppressor of G2 allele of SKP1